MRKAFLIISLILVSSLLSASPLTGFSITLTQAFERVEDENLLSVSSQSVKLLSKAAGDVTTSSDSGGGDSVVNVVVDEFIVNYCRDLTSVTFTVQSGGKANETIKSHYLSVSYCENLTSIDIDRSDLISGGLETLVATNNVVYDEKGEKKTGGMSTVNIEMLPGLRRVELQNNYLGTGLIEIGNFRYSNRKFEEYDWMSGNYLEYFSAYGNNIYQALNINGNGTKTSFRLGSGIPEDTAVAIRDFRITAEWWKSGNAYFRVANYSNSGYSGSKHGPGNSRRTYYNNGTVTRSQLTCEDGEEFTAEADINAGDWYSSGGYAYIYPFGQ